METSTTIWFGSPDSPGSPTTHNACLALGRSIFDVTPGVKPSDVVAWLRSNEFQSLNVADNRESTAPGIGDRTERFLLAVFRRLDEA